MPEQKAELWPIPHPKRGFHTDPCPGCGHALGIHADSLGCVHGWTWDDDGGSLTDGCECPLALAGENNPPTEKEV